MQFFNPSRWYLHPVFIFTCSIFALATFLIITINWYIEITSALEVIILKFHIDPKLIFPSKTGMTMLILITLISVVLAGILLAFIYYQKTIKLYRLQHNFIYNFTHELKTPVTSLKIYLETFILHSFKQDQIKKYSQSMLKDIERLTTNINSILNLARIESQNFNSEVVETNLESQIKEFCKKNSSLFRGLDIKIKNLSKQNTIYPVNLFLFEMLLTNIISNALKYNESNNPKLSIVFNDFPTKTTLDFVDNGIGVDKKEAKKIFRKFYQTKIENKNKILSSGLGLYLVSSIASIHGWKVLVTSKGKDQGSVFSITIPKKDLLPTKKYIWKQLKKTVSW